MIVEHEAKFEFDADADLPDLGTLLPGTTATDTETATLDATYYDVADLRLARWGITVRHRDGEGDARWTVKLPVRDVGTVASRREIDVTGGPATVPSEVLRLLAGHLRGEALAPVAGLRSERSRTLLVDAMGRAVAEVDDDRVTVVSGPRTGAAFREVEVELSQGGGKGSAGGGGATERNGTSRDKVFRAVEKALNSAGGRPAGREPKLLRALEPLNNPEPAVGRIDRGSSVREVIMASIARSTREILRSDPGVRVGDDPEDLHKMRVATRQMRSNLQTFSIALDAEWLSSIRQELGWLAGGLGHVRDADVLLERMSKAVIALDERDRTGGEELIALLGEDRTRAIDELAVIMGSTRYVELLERLLSAAVDPPTRASGLERAADIAPVLVTERWHELRRAVLRLSRKPSDADLHKARIRAKRCRYAAESVAPLSGRPARDFASTMALVQGSLGELHDSHAAQIWLRDAVKSPSQGITAGLLIAGERAKRRELLDAWEKAWKKASRPKRVAWLATFR